MSPILKFYYCLFSNVFFIPTINAFNCHLPDGCRLEYGFVQENFELNEIGDRLDIFVIICDINSKELRIKFKDPPTFVNGTKCLLNANYHSNKIIFKWTSKKLTILDKPFNFIYRYILNFNYSTEVHLWNLKGFDINFLGKNQIFYSPGISNIQLSKCRLDFYDDEKIINSCDEMSKSKIIRSIFQVRLFSIFDEYSLIRNRYIALRSVEYKQSICPLVFKNSLIHRLVLVDLTDTFYKRNVLSFENRTFRNLQSNISYLQLNKLQNINLDLKLLNLWVFYLTRVIFILSGSLNSIDGVIFRKFNNLDYFHINPVIFRKINHQP